MRLPSVKSFTKQQKYSETMLSATVRDFSGGWNILDDDLNLASNFSVKAFNIYRAADGTMSVRYGTRLFADCTNAFTTPGVAIVNMWYFNQSLIVVGANGEVLRVLGDGSISRIWDNSIAAVQPDAPDGWGVTTFASFAQFNSELIICNGSDKPLIVRNNFYVEYLHDEATGSNFNTPIAKYVCVCNRYLIMAGDPINPNRIHISARDTSGTFYGDPLPNDATYIDVGSSLPNASIIRGIAPFRDKLIVAFIEGTIIGTLGIYNDAGDTHEPNFDDVVAEWGCVSHRCLVSYGDDMLMMDQIGVPSLKRTVFTGTIKPERVSDLVDPEMTTKMEPLSFASLEDRTFSVYNQREGQFMFFVPNSDTAADTTETTCYSYVYRPNIKVGGWARFDGWNFTCAARTLEKNIFFGDADSKIWLYGSADNDFYSDKLGDPSVNNGDGVPIEFTWELPWSDVNARMKTKQARYIAMDTRGTAEFTAQMFVDRYFVNEQQQDAPACQMDFYGGDLFGFGDYDQPYGGGRNTANEQLWAWPAKFMLMKLRFTGSVTSKLKFVSLSLLYQNGGITR